MTVGGVSLSGRGLRLTLSRQRQSGVTRLTTHVFRRSRVSRSSVGHHYRPINEPCRPIKQLSLEKRQDGWRQVLALSGLRDCRGRRSSQGPLLVAGGSSLPFRTARELQPSRTCWARLKRQADSPLRSSCAAAQATSSPWSGGTRLVRAVTKGGRAAIRVGRGLRLRQRWHRPLPPHLFCMPACKRRLPR